MAKGKSIQVKRKRTLALDRKRLQRELSDETKPHRFVVRLSDADLRLLNQLARKLHCSRGQVVRTLLWQAKS